MRRAALTHDTLAVEKSETEATAGTCLKIHPEVEKELDCPDCYDTMLKLYDWDKINYFCENCGLTTANPSILSTYVSSGVKLKDNPVTLIYNIMLVRYYTVKLP